MRQATLLTMGTAQQLLDDLYMEVDPAMVYADRRSDMPEYGFIAWYLRTYFYLPMSAIHELMSMPNRGGSKGSTANKTIQAYKDSCMERPESLDARRYDTLQVFKSLAKEFYGATRNKALDICNEEERDCLLYLAHLECGRYDKGKRQGGGEVLYTLTPEEPSLITLLDILARIEHGEPAEDISRNYIFKSTY